MQTFIAATKIGQVIEVIASNQSQMKSGASKIQKLVPNLTYFIFLSCCIKSTALRTTFLTLFEPLVPT